MKKFGWILITALIIALGMGAVIVGADTTESGVVVERNYDVPLTSPGVGVVVDIAYIYDSMDDSIVYESITLFEADGEEHTYEIDFSLDEYVEGDYVKLVLENGETAYDIIALSWIADCSLESVVITVKDAEDSLIKINGALEEVADDAVIFVISLDGAAFDGVEIITAEELLEGDDYVADQIYIDGDTYVIYELWEGVAGIAYDSMDLMGLPGIDALVELSDGSYVLELWDGEEMDGKSISVSDSVISEGYADLIAKLSRPGVIVYDLFRGEVTDFSIVINGESMEAFLAEVYADYEEDYFITWEAADAVLTFDVDGEDYEAYMGTFDEFLGASKKYFEVNALVGYEKQYSGFYITGIDTIETEIEFVKGDAIFVDLTGNEAEIMDYADLVQGDEIIVIADGDYAVYVLLVARAEDVSARMDFDLPAPSTSVGMSAGLSVAYAAEESSDQTITVYGEDGELHVYDVSDVDPFVLAELREGDLVELSLLEGNKIDQMKIQAHWADNETDSVKLTVRDVETGEIRVRDSGNGLIDTGDYLLTEYNTIFVLHSDNDGSFASVELVDMDYLLMENAEFVMDQIRVPEGNFYMVDPAQVFTSCSIIAGSGEESLHEDADGNTVVTFADGKQLIVRDIYVDDIRDMGEGAVIYKESDGVLITVSEILDDLPIYFEDEIRLSRFWNAPVILASGYDIRPLVTETYEDLGVVTVAFGSLAEVGTDSTTLNTYSVNTSLESGLPVMDYVTVEPMTFSAENIVCNGKAFEDLRENDLVFVAAVEDGGVYLHFVEEAEADWWQDAVLMGDIVTDWNDYVDMPFGIVESVDDSEIYFHDIESDFVYQDGTVEYYDDDEEIEYVFCYNMDTGSLISPKDLRDGDVLYYIRDIGADRDADIYIEFCLIYPAKQGELGRVSSSYITVDGKKYNTIDCDECGIWSLYSWNDMYDFDFYDYDAVVDFEDIVTYAEGIIPGSFAYVSDDIYSVAEGVVVDFEYYEDGDDVGCAAITLMEADGEEHDYNGEMLPIDTLVDIKVGDYVSLLFDKDTLDDIISLADIYNCEYESIQIKVKDQEDHLIRIYDYNGYVGDYYGGLQELSKDAVIFSISLDGFVFDDVELISAEELLAGDEYTAAQIYMKGDVYVLYDLFGYDEYSGRAGENVFWTFDSFTGILTLSGSGLAEQGNWDHLTDDITSVTVGEDITDLDDDIFADMENLEKAYFYGEEAPEAVGWIFEDLGSESGEVIVYYRYWSVVPQWGDCIFTLIPDQITFSIHTGLSEAILETCLFMPAEINLSVYSDRLRNMRTVKDSVYNVTYFTDEEGNVYGPDETIILEDDLTLTAHWDSYLMIVDGTTFDMEEEAAGNGWSYFGGVLNLSGYNGGAVFANRSFILNVDSDNIIEGEGALISGELINLMIAEGAKLTLNDGYIDVGHLNINGSGDLTINSAAKNALVADSVVFAGVGILTAQATERAILSDSRHWEQKYLFFFSPEQEEGLPGYNSSAYLRLEPLTYSLVLDSKGGMWVDGSYEVRTEHIMHSEKVELLAYGKELTRSGYVLVGWTDAENEVEYAVNQHFGIKQDTQLYAVWQKEELIVNGASYSVNGISSGTGWRFSPAFGGKDAELTISSGYGGGRIFYPYDLTITVSSNAAIKGSVGEPAIRVLGDLTLNNNSATLSVAGGTGERGIHVDGDLILSNGGNLEILGGAGGQGVVAVGAIMLENSNAMSVVGGSGSEALFSRALALGGKGKTILVGNQQNAIGFFSSSMSLQLDSEYFTQDGNEITLNERDGYSYTSSGNIQLDDQMKYYGGKNASTVQRGKLLKQIYVLLTEKNIQVNLNPTGGTLADSTAASRTYSQGEDNAVVLALAEPSRFGYEFLGWNTRTDGSGEYYKDAETYIFDDSADELNLYAVWKELPYVAEVKNGKIELYLAANTSPDAVLLMAAYEGGRMIALEEGVVRGDGKWIFSTLPLDADIRLFVLNDRFQPLRNSYLIELD